MDDLVRIGVITSPHGIRGEVNVYPTTDTLERFRTVKKLQVERKGNYEEMEITSVKYFKNMVILKLSGIPDRNASETYREANLWIEKKDSPCKPGQYFVGDILGMEVQRENGTKLGIVSDVLETKANDIFEVTREDGKKVLLPVVSSCILSVNLEEKKIVANVVNGLEDL